MARCVSGSTVARARSSASPAGVSEKEAVRAPGEASTAAQRRSESRSRVRFWTWSRARFKSCLNRVIVVKRTPVARTKQAASAQPNRGGSAHRFFIGRIRPSFARPPSAPASPRTATRTLALIAGLGSAGGTRARTPRKDRDARRDVGSRPLLVRQKLTKPRESLPRPRFHGAERRAEPRGDLHLGEPVEVRALEHAAVLRLEGAQRNPDALADFVSRRPRRGILRRLSGAGFGLSLGALPRGGASIAVKRPRARHGQQPGRHGTAPAVVGRCGPPYLDPGFLQGVLRLGARAQDSQHHWIDQRRVPVVKLLQRARIAGVQAPDACDVLLLPRHDRG